MDTNRGNRRAIFLDRDGVINRKLPENQYVGKISQFVLLPGVGEALYDLQKKGFLLVVVTNQRGIARNLMTEQDLRTVHDFMASELERSGVVLEGIYYCPHEKFEGCECRKPQPGLILRAARDLHIDLENSYMVGDRESDTEAGRRAGTRTVLIGERNVCGADFVFQSLREFARSLDV